MLSLAGVQIIQVVIDFGLSAALIQKLEVTESQYHSSFNVILSLSIIITIFVFIKASLLAAWLGNPQIASLLKYLALIIPLGSLAIIPRVILARQLNFKKLTIAEIFSTIGYGGIAILLLFILKNVYCMIFGYIGEQLILLICLWLFSKWKPRFHFSWKAFREIIYFSGTVFSIRFVRLLNFNVFKVLINRFFGTATLGLYSLAFQIIDLPVQRIAKIMSKVMYPILSKLQQNRQEYKQLFLNTSFILLIVILPIYIVLFFASESFMAVFYGAKWLAAVPYLKILCLSGIVISLWTNLSLVAMSLGHPRLEFYLQISISGALFSGVFVIKHFGMEAILIYFTCILSGLFMYGFYRIFNWLRITPKEFISHFWKPVASNLILILVLYGIMQLEAFSFSKEYIPELIKVLTFSIIFYPIILLVLDKSRLISLLRTAMHPEHP
ncbi:MAG: oligosaccharide flippase family protein [Aliifodinibius sp.]|nr:oligosaccharide flippase family protein [Fodinibius sp.]